jgi:NAD+ kinase
MPNDLIIIRHGHSEGNLAVETAKLGDNSFYTPEFRERPGHQWRLTKEGQAQAVTTGEWLQKNIDIDFDRYYVSPYIRTRETAGLLNLPNTEWRISQRLRERDWGDIDAIPLEEFKNIFPHNALRKEIDALYWRPPSGESIADVRLRVRSFFDTLHRECADKRVVVVTHGEFMWAMRAELEYLNDEQWIAADKDPKMKIFNTQVLHYTKNNPSSGDNSHYLGWVRSVCSWKNLDTGWKKIERNRYTNKQLLDQVDRIEPILNNEV